MTTVHATCIDLDGKGVLLRGPSGAGKSDLALRLIDGGAQLVGDDYVHVVIEDETLVARAPDTIAGIMEVRGLGLVRVPHLPRSTLALVADLVEPDMISRLPEVTMTTLPGVESIPIRRVRIAAFEASAAAKIRAAVTAEIITDDV